MLFDTKRHRYVVRIYPHFDRVNTPLNTTFLSSDSKQPSHGLGNVLSQIVLGKSIKPDFNAEEKLSIEKDTREIRIIVAEMADYLPKEDPDKGWQKLL
jgi:hypothetical protein